METLDLHGARHDDVERLVENFILLTDMPVKVITGNSLFMKSVVFDLAERHGFQWEYESFWNLGAVVLTEPPP
jgi:hypothetical protein